MARDPSTFAYVRLNPEQDSRVATVPAIEPPSAPSDTASPTGDSNPADGATDSNSGDEKKDEKDRPGDRDLVQVGQSVHVSASDKANDVVVIFGDATIDGTADGDVVVVGGTLTVKGTITGDCINVGMGVKLEPSARVKGDVVGVGGGVIRADGAQVDGSVVPIHLIHFGPNLPLWISQTWEECVLKLRPSAISVPWTVVASVIFILLYTLIGLLFPDSVEKSARQISERGISSVFIGLLAIPSVAFFLFFLAVSVIFIPLVPLVAAPLVFGAMIGKAGLLRQMGVALFKPFGANIAVPVSVLTGGIVLALVYLVPVIGLFAWALTLTLGFGAFTQSIFRRNRPASPLSGAPSPMTSPGSPNRPFTAEFTGGNPTWASRTSSPSATTLSSNVPPLETSSATTEPGKSVAGVPVSTPSSAVVTEAVVTEDSGTKSGNPPVPALALAFASTPAASPEDVVTDSSRPAVPTPTPVIPSGTSGGPPLGPTSPTNPLNSSSGSPRAAASLPPVPPSLPHPLTPAELLALPRVGLAPRLLPLFFDWMIVAALIHGPILDLSRHRLLCSFLELAYFAGFYLWRGATPMGLIFGLRVVRLDGRPLDLPCVLVRGVAAGVGAVAAGIGYFWCAWDPEQQTWHDKLAGTVVVKTSRTTSLV